MPTLHLWYGSFHRSWILKVESIFKIVDILFHYFKFSIHSPLPLSSDILPELRKHPNLTKGQSFHLCSRCHLYHLQVGINLEISSVPSITSHLLYSLTGSIPYYSSSHLLKKKKTWLLLKYTCISFFLL